MHPIPKPELLDADRISRDDREGMSLEDHRSQAQLLEKALRESCAYADQLWEQLDAVRRYLLDSLPPDPRAPGPHVAAAAPTGPDDEQGWQNWMTAFADTTSVLCGSHGDSGFGASRARQEAQLRRLVPPTSTSRLPEDTAATSDPDAPPDPLPPARTTPEQPSTAAGREPIITAAKAVSATILAVLAIRGLRPRPHTDPPRSSRRHPTTN